MRRPAKPSIALALVAGAIALAVAPVSAETGIAISPAILSVEGRAGGGGSVSISVSNRGDETIDIVTATTQFRDMEGERSATEWTTVRPKRLQLQPNTTSTATVKIEIPDDIVSGGRYAAVTFSMVPSRTDDSGISIAGRVVVPVLLVVHGEGQLSRRPVLERYAPVIEADGRLGFRALVRNDGNVHALVSGVVSVGPPGEEPGASVEIAGRYVLPNTERVFASQGTLSPPQRERLHSTATFFPPADADSKDYRAITASLEFDPEPRLTQLEAQVCENLDRGPSIRGSLENVGEVGLLPIIRFEIHDGNGALVGSTNPQESPIAWPAETLEVSAEIYRRLLSGPYTLLTTISYGAGSTLKSTTPFSIGGDLATTAPLCPSVDPPTEG